MKRKAEGLGYEVSTLSDPNLLKAAYAEFKPDMIMLDIEAIKLVKWLAEQNCTARILPGALS